MNNVGTDTGARKAMLGGGKMNEFDIVIDALTVLQDYCLNGACSSCKLWKYRVCDGIGMIDISMIESLKEEEYEK